MGRFVIGALAGGLAVWFWGDKLRKLADVKTRDVREMAADQLQAAGQKTTAVLDRTRDQITSTLQAGEDAIRPRMGT
jgi:hypothetical protein